MGNRIVYTTELAPKDPSNDKAWKGIQVVTGGLDDPSHQEVLDHWQSQGVPWDDATALIQSSVQAGMVFIVQDVFGFGGMENIKKYALTERAVEDARGTWRSRP